LHGTTPRFCLFIYGCLGVACKRSRTSFPLPFEVISDIKQYERKWYWRYTSSPCSNPAASASSSLISRQATSRSTRRSRRCSTERKRWFLHRRCARSVDSNEDTPFAMREIFIDARALSAVETVLPCIRARNRSQSIVLRAGGATNGTEKRVAARTILENPSSSNSLLCRGMSRASAST